MGKERGGAHEAFDGCGFFGLVPDMLSVMTAEGQLQQANPAWEKHLGYAVSELLGRPICHLVHPDDLQSTELEMARLCSGQRTINFINRLRAKSGEWLWMEWNASSADGFVYAVARNITRRMLAAQRTRLLTDAFQHCTHGLAIEDPEEGVILACNPAFAALHGRTVEEMVGNRLFEFYPDSQVDVVRSCISRASELGSCQFEAFKIHRDGGQVPVQVDIVFVRDEHGEPLYRIVTAEDITERRKAEKALRESEGRFRAVVESAPEGIFIQAAGDFAYLNPAALRMFGAETEGELLGRPVVGQLHPEYRERVRELIRKLNDEDIGLPFPEERRFIRCDGTFFSTDVSAVPFRHEGRKGALVFMHDTSERKRLEEEGRRLEQALSQSQKMESIGRLAGGVAHDLNNLLTPILGYAEILDDQFSPDDERLQDIRAIHGAGIRARDLVRQLLVFSRRQALDFHVLDLNAAVRGFQQLLRRTMQDNVIMDLSLSEEPLPIRGDLGQIEQIMMNLAVNAQDSMQGGGTLLIETASVPAALMPKEVAEAVGADDCAVLRFTDGGSGMEREVLANIFEPFFTTKARGRGTGLGLATVYGIARQHSGMVTVSSEPGKGSVFSVYFPLRSSEPIAAPEGDGGVPESAAGRGGSVLVVEDDAVVRSFVADVLRNAGYLVVDTDGGESALERVGDGSDCPDLLLTDIVMPGMNGRELYEAVSQRCPDLPVLFMSGYAMNVLDREGLPERGVGYLQKPFSVGELLEEVSALMTGQRERGGKIKKPKPKM